MRYASICDGIGAVHCAWRPLGWDCTWTSEIEGFPIAVVEEAWPGTVNLGDMLRITEATLDEHARPDVVVGGTPCQSFSVAGLRGGLADPRGNLAVRFMQLVGVLRPAWVVWENVPGVLSSNGGRDFGSIVGALVDLGYGFAYRVLDAQFFGVPQRRRRVFVVGCSRGWQRAAAVLFEREGVRGNPPTREAEGQGTASDAGRGAAGASWWDGGQLSQTLDAVPSKGQTMPEKNRFPAVLEPVAHTSDGVQPVTYDLFQITAPVNKQSRKPSDPCHTIAKDNAAHAAVATPATVRRLTPRECERLQGFPDDYTLIPWRKKPAEECPDGPRYRALGNSMAVPVMRWIGERIQAVEAIA